MEVEKLNAEFKADNEQLDAENDKSKKLEVEQLQLDWSPFSEQVAFLASFVKNDLTKGLLVDYYYDSVDKVCEIQLARLCEYRVI